MKRNERIISLENGDWLSVTEDRPDIPSKATVIFCHGLSGDKVGPQKLLTLLSSKISSCSSVRVLRFDFRGSGLSSGAFLNTSLDMMIREAVFIADNLTSDLETVIWMGFSTGSLIALIASALRKKNERVVAISNGFTEEISFLGAEDVVSIRDGQFFLPKTYFLEREKLQPRKNFFPFCSKIDCILAVELRLG
ncbi:MAG: alpha/beta hydrolase [Verrucomicrobia bacterium]|nr:alpha/beta hydrolase [Verrucomicrobiota bacterium]